MAGEERPDLADGDEVTLATHAHVNADANAPDAHKPALQVIVLVRLYSQFLDSCLVIAFHCISISRKVSLSLIPAAFAPCFVRLATCDKNYPFFGPALRSAEEPFHHMMAAFDLAFGTAP